MATWPSTLPCFLVDGYQESPVSTVLSSNVDGGAPKYRRRYTKGYRNIQASVFMTSEQVEEFEEFFENEMIDVIPFGKENPRTGKPMSCLMVGDEPYTITPIDDGQQFWRVSFTIQTVP